ncbi:DUF2971 domain-containing protein [Providencia rettgeri]|nr:DUF2971 domain-containing protein [Providencia rettgeri]
MGDDRKDARTFFWKRNIIKIVAHCFFNKIMCLLSIFMNLFFVSDDTILGIYVSISLVKLFLGFSKLENSSERLYRIINFQHAVQIFEKGEMYFSHPSKWDDPYETRLVHSELDRVYAQCWCKNGVSDAMWRIYSPTHLGVRIGTSAKKLNKALSSGVKNLGIDIRMEDVKYLSQHDLNRETKCIQNKLKENFNLGLATNLLFMKREAYEHESECRVIATCQSTSSKMTNNGIKIQIDAKRMIDSILIDPRAPTELADALIYYFKNKIGFTKKCQKSVLYKTPKSYIFE